MSVLKTCRGARVWCEGSPDAGGLVGEGTFVGEEAGGGVPVSFITSSSPDMGGNTWQEGDVKTSD